MADPAAVPAAQLRWALKSALVAASTDPERHVLCGVQAEGLPHAVDSGPLPHAAGTVRFVATDGHRLHVCDLYAPEAARVLEGARIWTRASVEALLKALPARKAAPPAVIVSTTEVDSGAGARVRVALIDARFPDYHQVVPARAEAGATGIALWACNPRYLAEAAACVPCAEREPTVRLSVPDDMLRPVRLDGEHPDVGRFCAVIMPQRTAYPRARAAMTRAPAT